MIPDRRRFRRTLNESTSNVLSDFLTEYDAAPSRVRNQIKKALAGKVRTVDPEAEQILKILTGLGDASSIKNITKIIDQTKTGQVSPTRKQKPRTPSPSAEEVLRTIYDNEDEIARIVTNKKTVDSLSGAIKSAVAEIETKIQALRADDLQAIGKAIGFTQPSRNRKDEVRKNVIFHVRRRLERLSDRWRSTYTGRL